MTVPFTVKVEIAFATSPNVAPTWTDVTNYVLATASRPITINRGRGDQFSDVSPSTLSLVLDNVDGRFTAGYTAGAYYPNVKKGRRIRVSATYSAVQYFRFDGYVDQWPVEWAGGMKAYAEAQITATDRLARMGRRAQLRSIVEEEAAVDGAVAEWPLGDQAGSTMAGETSGNNETPLSVLQQGTGGTLAFGDGIGSPTDSLSAPILTSVDASNGKYLGGAMVNLYGGYTATGVTLECGFLSTTNRVQLIASWESTAGRDRVELQVTAAGKLQAQSYGIGGGGAANYTLTSAATVTDNVTHTAMLTQSLSGGTVTVVLYLDGASAGTTTYSNTIPAFTQVYAGGRGDSRCFHGTLNHVSVYATAISAARASQHSLARTTGFSGESSNARISRLAGYAGVAVGDMALETGTSTSLVAQDTTGNAPLDMVHTVEHTENGLVFMSGDGKLTFHARSHRYNQSAAFTLDASLDELQPDLKFVEDDFGLANDVTVTRSTGSVSRATNPASIVEYDLYRVALDSVSTSDNEAVSAANWRVNNYGTPQRRCPSVGVDLAQQPAKIPTIAGSDLGAKFTITNLPTQAPAASVDLNIEGYTESLGLDVWQLVFNASSSTSSLVWQLNSGSYSQLGTTTKLGY